VTHPRDFGPRYTFERELGRGGMGAVFQARDLHLDRDVALKVVHELPVSLDGLEHVEREFTLLARLVHPAIARAFDFGYFDGSPYFTSELIQGRRPAEGSALGDEELLEIAVSLAGAAAFLHQNGILHLDIKPANIVVPDDRKRGGAVLIDFGLCRRAQSDLALRAKLWGSRPYMAPEYFSDGPLGPWTDVYALGMTLYRLAAGRFPSSVEPPSRYRRFAERGIARGLDAIILKCLAHSPAARPRSGSEVLEALLKLPRKPAPASPAGAARHVVGREAELEAAERYLQALRESGARPASLLVSGPPGIGQSAFLHEVKLRAQTRGIPCYLETGFAGSPGAPGSVLRFLETHIPKHEAAARSRWSGFLRGLRRPHDASWTGSPDAERRLRFAHEIRLAVAAVKEPVLLIADGLERLDEVSVGLVLELVRLLEAMEASERPPLGAILGYREEGPARDLLREVSRLLLSRSAGGVITLQPLSIEATRALYERLTSARGPEHEGLGLYQRTQGVPGRIALLAAERRLEEESESLEDSCSGDVAGRERELAVLLCLLGRPVTAREASRLLGSSRTQVDRLLELLERRGLARKLDPELPRGAWIAAGECERLADALEPPERLRFHRRIGDALAGRAARDGALGLVEALRHFRSAGAAPSVVKHGLRAARYLQSTHQHRAALNAFAAVLEALPARERRVRHETTLEMAGLQARVGDLENGIRSLREIRLRHRDLTPGERARVDLLLATLYSRHGDFRRAAAIFAANLEAERTRRSRLKAQDLLVLLNEYAVVKAYLGDHDEAVRLCDEGLALASGSRKASVREVALNLLATRANVALRQFKTEAAVKDFERALEIAEALDSALNQSVILNNLGIAYMQCERHAEAIRVLQEAERACMELDQGPALASIHCNLAVLHARLGDFSSSDAAMEKAARLPASALGPRQELLLEHSRGICGIYRGRYSEARAHLERAIARARSIGDRHIASFDEVYRAEALLFEGKLADAAEALDRLADADQAGLAGEGCEVARMALARKAFLHAMAGDADRAAEAVERCGRAGGRRHPFLDAWNALFLGWALSLAGHPVRARACLRRAAAFFEEKRALPALALARCVQAEELLIEGKASEARAALDEVPAGSSGLASVLQPILEARLLLAGAMGKSERAQAMDLLADAGARLADNPLPAWEAQIQTLRARLGEGERSKASCSAVRKEARTAPIAANAAGPWRSRLVTESPAMQRLAGALDRLRGTELSVLIRGETGSGKELIARILHEESPRRHGPFQSVDLRAIPAGLLEAELFGARAGAFTGLERDRKGILAACAGGAVLLEEVSEIDAGSQAKLLRVLTEHAVRPLGAEDPVAIDTRFIFSTSTDLAAAVRERRLRSELYHRMGSLTLEVPPLRQRPEDLPELARRFLEEDAPGAGEITLDGAALDFLKSQSWPGNVRELRNFLRRLRLERSGEVDLDDVRAILTEAEPSLVFPRNLLAQKDLAPLRERLERDYVLYHLRRLHARLDALGEFLKLGRRQLYRLLRRLGISIREERRRSGG